MMARKGYGGLTAVQAPVAVLLIIFANHIGSSQAGQNEDGGEGTIVGTTAGERQLLGQWFEGDPPALPVVPLSTARKTDPLALTNPVNAPPVLAWCVSSDNEVELCLKMVAILNNLGGDYTFRCMQKVDARACLEAVYDNEADIVSLEAGDAFLGFYVWRLKAIVSEVYGYAVDGRADSRTNAVAVVHKDMCTANPNLTFSDLRGLVSCHTGYRMTAGWVIPVGFMSDTGAMVPTNTRDDIPNDIETVKSFFSASCAPGPSANARVCSACAGDCSYSDPFAGYPGAMNCLMNGGGDVAFVELGTTTDYSKGGMLAESWAKKNPSDFMFLCPNKGCSPVNESDHDCVMGTVPPHTVMVRKGMKASEVTAAIMAASAKDEFKNLLFQGLNTNGGIFRKEAIGLSIVNNEDTLTFLGPQTVDVYSSMYDLDAAALQTNVVRMCTTSAPELAKCQATVPLLEDVNDSLNWDCVIRRSVAECTNAVVNGEAELVSLDGRDMYNAITSSQLVPLAAQNYDTTANSSLTHKAVAVVHAKFCTAQDSPRLSALAGKSSCHGGHKSSSGWDVPMGYMLFTNNLRPINWNSQLANDVESVENVFGQVCAPNVNATMQLCSACGGDCRTHAGVYAGDGGAFRGLEEGRCDVAFVKHTTVGTYSQGGTSAKNWSKHNASEYRYLCPQGGCAPIGSHDICSFGDVPSESMMASAKMSDGRKKAIKNAIFAASRTPEWAALFYNKNDEGYIFQASMVAMNPIDIDPLNFLSPAKPYFDELKALDAVTLTSPPAHRRRHKKKSTGIIVAIVCGVVGGAGLLLAIACLCFARKKRNNHYDDLARTRLGPA